MTMTFGEKLAMLRGNKNISKSMFAKIMGVSFVTLCKYEEGETVPDIHFLEKLCRLFKVDAAWLLGLDKNNEFCDIGAKCNDEILCISVPEMCKLLGISRKLGYILVGYDGFYPAFRIGKKILIRKDMLMKWLSEQKYTCLSDANALDDFVDEE